MILVRNKGLKPLVRNEIRAELCKGKYTFGIKDGKVELAAEASK